MPCQGVEPRTSRKSGERSTAELTGLVLLQRAARWDRTTDLPHVKRMLFQLRYGDFSLTYPSRDSNPEPLPSEGSVSAESWARGALDPLATVQGPAGLPAHPSVMPEAGRAGAIRTRESPSPELGGLPNFPTARCVATCFTQLYVKHGVP